MHCVFCFRNLFPSDPRTAEICKNITETKRVNAVLRSPVSKGIEWVHDTPLFVPLRGGCCDTKRRIDLWTMVGNVVFAIEIDEHQHKDRAVNYEEERYNDLAMDFTGQFVFLRINPDPFKMGGRKRDPPFQERFETVERKMREILPRLTLQRDDSDPILQVHRLFFDD